MVKKELCPAVFLDRDGVICRTFVRNGKPYAPRKLKSFILMPNAQRSVALLKQFGFKVIVVTNQPDIGNGLVPLEEVEAMHLKLYEKTMIDDVFMCTHRQDEGCDCRKPNPGMLNKASLKHSIDLKKSFMIGDRSSDIEAGNKAGCKTIFIDRHYKETRPLQFHAIVNSLQSAVAYIITTRC
ncbi:MAG: HAD family hydrolase [Bacteroidetes bacterium]|nr:HAD family hydrolase [Bacteroidota bacterium]